MMGQETNVKPENTESGAGGGSRARRCRADPPCEGPCITVRVAPGGPTLPWWQLAAYRRNALKAREGRTLDRLCAAILNRTGRGFCFPVFVWSGHDYVIDGAGRMPALERLEAEGHVIPEVLPVSQIEAASEEEAAELVLMASSDHGEVTEASLANFADVHELQLEKLAGVVAFQGVALEDVARRQKEILAGEGGGAGAGEGEGAYTQKVESPVYVPTGERPEVSELMDRSVTEGLLEEIREIDLPADVRALLEHAAERHTVFRYDRLAEFYAHAPAEVQRLFEASALVIIDFGDAIERGFVQLNEELAVAFRKDYPDA